MIYWVRFPGVTLEHHLEKTLTFLAFFDGSSKHKEFLEAQDPWPGFEEDQKTGVKFQDRFWTEDVLCFFKDIQLHPILGYSKYSTPIYFTFLARFLGISNT